LEDDQDLPLNLSPAQTRIFKAQVVD